MKNKSFGRKMICLMLLSLLAVCGCGNAEEGTQDGRGDVFQAATKVSTVKRLFSEKNHSAFYAVREDGSLWRWGTFMNEDGSDRTAVTPEKFTLPGIDLRGKVKKVCMACSSDFLLLEDGSLYSWGKNDRFGILGDGTTERRATPKK